MMRKGGRKRCDTISKAKKHSKLMKKRNEDAKLVATKVKQLIKDYRLKYEDKLNEDKLKYVSNALDLFKVSKRLKSNLIPKQAIRYYTNIDMNSKLEDVGYCIMNLVQIDIIKNIKSMIISNKKIFKEAWRVIGNEKHRNMLYINPNVTKILQLESIFQAILNYLPEGSKVIDPSLLFSKAGCKIQPSIHTDYVFKKDDLYIKTAQSGNYWTLPLSIIIAIDKCSLVIYPKSHRFFVMSAKELKNSSPIQAVIVTINPGQAIFFRTDLIHQGNGYRCDNYRIHCFSSCSDSSTCLGINQVVFPHKYDKINKILSPDMLGKLVNKLNQ